ncbi:C39 family peptidase [Brevibacillus borstelensis]|uniref:C39 family peptidase n=1 Tax=Brevibacillus borstelensis TaxID=45462 RepID=UPI003CF52D1B
MYKKSIKKFFVLGVAAVSLSILATVSSPSHAASTTVTLGVKKVTQAAELWCWAASSVSVLDYFGIKVTQSDFVEYVKGEVSNKSGNISEVMDGLDHYGLQSYREDNSLTFKETVREINNDIPVLARIKWKTGNTAIGHMVVIDGYTNSSTKYLRYMDPDKGEYSIMTYDRFVDSSGQEWTHTIYGFEEN